MISEKPLTHFTAVVWGSTVVLKPHVKTRTEGHPIICLRVLQLIFTFTTVHKQSTLATSVFSDVMAGVDML
jgi:hypothetical protein